MQTNDDGKLKTALRLLECNSFLGGLVFYAPVALLVRTERGITVSQFFILEAILSLTVFLGEIPAGWLTDKIGYQKSLFLAGVILFSARVVLFFAGSFPVFLVEAVLEGISSCFVSGTQEAYLYSFWRKEEYAVNLGKIANYGTVGFILSTVSYAFLMHWFGLTGLIAATGIANALAIAVIAVLPPEAHHTTPAPVSIPSFREMWENVKHMLKTSSGIYIVGNSLFAVSTLVTNFFYIIKVTRAGLPKETMTIVIIGYSLVSFLSPMIVKRFSQKHYKRTLTVYLATGAAFFIGLFFCDGWAAVALMILGPLVLNVPTFLFGELLNENVDERDMDDSRAAALSVYNIGCNALEITFLFLSAAVSDQEGNTSFLLVAVAYAAVAVIFAFDLRRNNGRAGENQEEQPGEQQIPE